MGKSPRPTAASLSRAIVSEVSYRADLCATRDPNGGFRTGHADQEELVGRWILYRE